MLPRPSRDKLGMMGGLRSPSNNNLCKTLDFKNAVILSEGEPVVYFHPKTYPSRSRRTQPEKQERMDGVTG